MMLPRKGEINDSYPYSNLFGLFLLGKDNLQLLNRLVSPVRGGLFVELDDQNILSSVGATRYVSIKQITGRSYGAISSLLDFISTNRMPLWG